MAAVTENDIELEPQQHMKVPLIYSAVLHAAFVVIAIVGLPYLKPDLPDIVDPITVELVDVAEITQTNKPPPPEPVHTPKPEQRSEEPPRPVQPQVTAPTPPKPTPPKPPEPVKQEVAPPEPEVAPPEVKPEPAKAVTPPKPLKRPEPPPKEPEKVIEQNHEEFKSLLRNLMPAEETPVQTDAQGQGQASSMLTRFSQQMTMSEMDSLKRQLSQCWSVMAGARYAEDLVVDIKLFMNHDRTVRDAQIQNRMRYGTDSFFRAAADSALRAVYRCSPLDLPPDKYDLWKIITVTFDPRTML